MMRIESWNGIKCLCCDELPEQQNEFVNQNVDFVQCSIAPSDTKAAEWLLNHGFFFADRKVDVRVRINNIPVKQYKRRFQTKCEPQSSDEGQKKKIFEILCKAFTHDRRFHLRQHYDCKLASRIISAYHQHAEESEMKKILCRFKEEIIGALYLQQTKDGFFVYLAAVLPEYQGTGAAVELYQEAVVYCKQQNGMILSGCISSANTGVMNIYGQFGGTFHHETDIYMLEKKG